MSAWPVGLPQTPIAAGFTQTPVDAVVRSSMDYGPDKVRRRTTARIQVVQMNFVLTSSECGTLDGFYDSTLGGGVLPFDWVNHMSTSSPKASAVYRFMAPPTYSAMEADLWNVALQLEMLP